MKINEEYWVNLYNNKKIEIDFETGNVYSYLSGKKYLLGSKNNQNYLSSSAGPNKKVRYSILLHRLIWIATNGDILDKIEVNHKNGIKTDNRLCNLELVDKSEQALHSRRVLGNKGGVMYGEEHGRAVLTEKDVLSIKKEYQKGVVTLKFLANKYNVHFSTIKDILTGKNWGWLK